jgi:hypothetical protein
MERGTRTGRPRDLDRGGIAPANDDETLRQAKLELGAAKGRIDAVYQRLGRMAGTLGGNRRSDRWTLNLVSQWLETINEMIDDAVSSLDEIDYA